MGTYEQAMANLAPWRHMRPTRWHTETFRDVCFRLVAQWAAYASKRGFARDCSIRQKGKQLGISYEQVRRFLRRYEANPRELQIITARHRPLTLGDWQEEHRRNCEQQSMGMVRSRYRGKVNAYRRAQPIVVQACQSGRHKASRINKNVVENEDEFTEWERMG